VKKLLSIGALALCAAILGTCAHPPTLLEEIQASGILRVATRSGPNTYYTVADGPVGPEYDLIRLFAEDLGVRLELQVLDDADDVLAAVASGQAHVGAAALTITPEAERQVNFGPVYQQVTEHLIYKDGRRRPRDLRQIRGRRLEVPGGSSHVETLRTAQARYPDLVWTENPHIDQTELVTQVAEGDIDYTLVKSTAFAIYRSFIPDIRVAFNVAEGESLAWAFPKRHDSSLMQAAQRFFDKLRTSGELDRILDHYYAGMPRAEYVGTRNFTRDVRERLPAYRKLFRRAGEEYGIDWRLLAAIGYQESKWDPEAVSPTGVRGIMMLTEQTALAVGVANRTDPSESIRGGARYLARILASLPRQIEPSDRMWFALATYNMGYGHLLDARRLTRSRGGDPNRWADVRPNVRLLSDPVNHTQLRHGYARGGETVNFVNNVRTYYNVLAWLTKEEGPGAGWMPQQSAPPPPAAIQADLDPPAAERGTTART
jgi:membrane-bound lytic murein transglycosylase F